MKIIGFSSKNRYLTIVNIFLVVVALIAAIVGCTGESYILTLSSTAGGSVSAPGEGIFTYNGGTTVNLAAEAEDGYRFTEWTGNVSTVADVYAAATTITINGDYSITAEFVKQYELTTSSTTGGSVTDPGEGVYTYDEGEVVDLVVTPDAGYGFTNWTGEVGTIADVYSATTTVTMNDDYPITANFEPLVWDFTITLTCHLTVPSSLSPLAQNVFSPWIGELEAITGTLGGKFEVNVTYGEAPFSAAASLMAISTGTVDIGQLSPETFNLGGAGYLPWKFPSIESVAYTTYHLWTENDAEWDASGELSLVKVLITAPLWGSQLWSTTYSGNMTVAADWVDVDMRTDAQAVHAYSIWSMGAIPVYLELADLSGALDSAVINACLFTYYGIDSAIGLSGSTEYTTELNMLYKPYSLAMNKDSYDALPLEARIALDSVCGADKSVDFATAHLAGESAYEADTEADRHIYAPAPSEMDDYEAAVANVDDWWAGNMTVLGFDGAGIINRIDELIAAGP